MLYWLGRFSPFSRSPNQTVHQWHFANELKIILRWTNCNRTSKTTNSQTEFRAYTKRPNQIPRKPFFHHLYTSLSFGTRTRTKTPTPGHPDLFGYPVEFSNKYFDKVRDRVRLDQLSMDVVRRARVQPYYICAKRCTYRFGKVIRWHTSYLLGMKMRCPVCWMGSLQR